SRCTNTTYATTPSSIPLPPIFLSFSIHPRTSAFYTLSLHDALPIWIAPSPAASSSSSSALLPATRPERVSSSAGPTSEELTRSRSEEHTSELQSPDHLVCGVRLEKNNNADESKQRRQGVRTGLWTGG